MPEYTIREPELQVAVNPETGEVKTLQDQRFPWTEKKMKTIKLAKLYKKAGFDEYSFRSACCSTWLEFGLHSDGDVRLQAANFCQLRLCPLCTSRRAKKNAYKLSKVLDRVQEDHDAMYLFLTLTVKNVAGNELGDAIGQLTGSWTKLIRHRQFERAVKGWFRAIEVTRKGKGYHPHIHAILAVEPAYFARKAGLYITHDEWVRHWRLALKADYDPSVRIQTAKAKGQMIAGRAAALEAAKYTVKDSDFIDPKLPEAEAVQIVTDYTLGLHGRRLTAFGGWMKEAAAALKLADMEEDTDLVHTGTIREDLAEFIVQYHWHFGAGDYILTSAEVNPLKLVPAEQR